MKQSLFLTAIALGLMGCELNMSGLFSLNQNMTAINSEGQSVILPAGNHQADIQIKDKSIKVQFPTLAAQIKIKMTKEQREWLAHNRETLLPAKTSGQPFDVLATVITRTLDVRTYDTTQSCTRYVYETTCSYRQCTRIAIPISGWQRVQVTEKDVQSDAQMKIYKTGTQELLSSATAQTGVKTHTQTTALGYCY